MPNGIQFNFNAANYPPKTLRTVRDIGASLGFRRCGPDADVMSKLIMLSNRVHSRPRKAAVWYMYVCLSVCLSVRPSVGCLYVSPAGK